VGWVLMLSLMVLASGELLFAQPAAPAAPEAGRGLFPPQSTVVLLSGLPGDVESENDYSQQLAAWLELVASSGSVQKLLVLCDQPGTVKLPEKVQGEVLKADRKTFVGLAQALGQGTRSLVVIAWGHGSRQGNAPVFHVRGPRLTAADFKELAGHVGQAESRWVLMFRGSGAFAAQLAGSGRQVLASERETSFSSDPVEMELLLKLARAEPGLSFEALSEKLGQATAAWYSERSLARTEEPTLWVGQESPRLLARADGQEAGAEAKSKETKETAKADNAEPTKPAEAIVNPIPRPQPRVAPEPAGPLATNLPASWGGIKRVEPQKYPEADGVILRQRLTYTLASSPAIVSEQEQFIQVLTAEGKRYGDFDVSFSPPFEDINFLDCEVLGPDGKLLRLEPDAIRESREASAGDYQTGHRKFFSLPGVVAGSVLHVRYRTKWEKFPLPQVSLPIPVGSELPVVDSTIEVSVPKASAFHFAFERVAAPKPVIKEASYGTTYSWHLENLPAEERESLVPPGQQRRLLVSTFPDWAAFAEWYGRISKLTDEVTPEIAAKAAELTRGTTNQRAKMVAVYNYVTGLRYVAVPLGVNSFRPHAAANVFHNQFGDCKDKANLFNALLHSLHIEARLVLVPRFSQAQDGLPGLSFNHAISQVTLEGQTLWVDTTDDVCRFGLLPPGDPGRKVLVVDGQSTALTPLPMPEPREHELKLHGQMTCSAPGSPLAVTLNAVGQGFPDYELRSAAREAKGHRASLPLLAARFRPVAGSFALEKQSATSVAALDENFTWQAAGTCVGNTTVADGKLLVHSPFWVPKEWDVALHHRKAPLFLNLGYPLTLEEEFELALPARAQPLVLPGVVENKAAPLRWRIEWKKSGEDRVAAHFRAELAQGELSAADTPLLQAQLRELLSAMAASATVSLPP
jgi:transglutaminase-like putative cysteine protease